MIQKHPTSPELRCVQYGAVLQYETERDGTDFSVKQMNCYSSAWTELIAQRRLQGDCYRNYLKMGEGALTLKHHHGSESYGTDFFVKQMDRYSPASVEMIAYLRD